jgi:hypothetical protein
VLAVIFLAVAASILYCEHQNSTDVPPPTQSELRASFEKAAAWIQQHREATLRENNSMLWLFVREAGRLSGNSQLAALATEYQDRSTQGTIAQFFFNPQGSEQIRTTRLDLSDWQGYQRLFVYGATCNVSLRFDPEVVSMLGPNACNEGHAWLRNPWCRTHQLMGLRFVQKNHCEPDADTARVIEATQAGILSELRWDYRVEDAYLQKVWTLIESGRRDTIKSVWVRRILDAQRPDGSWTGVDVIAPLPGGRALVWGGGVHPRIVPQPEPTFHATAQGLYLMALLLH